MPDLEGFVHKFTGERKKGPSRCEGDLLLSHLPSNSNPQLLFCPGLMQDIARRAECGGWSLANKVVGSHHTHPWSKKWQRKEIDFWNCFNAEINFHGVVQTTCMGVKCLRASLLEEFTYREFMQELHVTIQFQIKIKKNKANASVWSVWEQASWKSSRTKLQSSCKPIPTQKKNKSNASVWSFWEQASWKSSRTKLQSSCKSCV